jgi:predicted heme/steroid binding protein
VENQERLITRQELLKHDGERSPRKWVAHNGIVFDVTDCPRWQKELHEQLHFPGQDLTGELADAPHKEDVFSRPGVKIVGRLKV